MQSDWLDNIDWLMLGLGIVVGVVGQVILTFALTGAGVSLQSSAVLVLTLAMVFLASIIAAHRALERGARLLNALAAALVIACISLVASVYANPLNGTNVPGLLFLFGSYTLMGVLGVVLLEGWQRMRANP